MKFKDLEIYENRNKVMCISTSMGMKLTEVFEQSIECLKHFNYKSAFIVDIAGVDIPVFKDMTVEDAAAMFRCKREIYIQESIEKSLIKKYNPEVLNEK